MTVAIFGSYIYSYACTYAYRGDLGLVALVHGEVGQRAHHAGLHLDVAHVHARGLQQVRVRVG